MRAENSDHLDAGFGIGVGQVGHVGVVDAEGGLSLQAVVAPDVEQAAARAAAARAAEEAEDDAMSDDELGDEEGAAVADCLACEGQTSAVALMKGCLG